MSRTTVITICLTLNLGLALGASAQDPRWLRMLEKAQGERPESIESTARIAPEGEPGTPMVIRGRVYDEKGTAPVPGIIVFAYQTDRNGLYHAPGASGWRLRGWARTDEQGRFEFRTIRPGSYPSGRTPAHIHFTLEGTDAGPQWTGELRFGNDPLLTRSDRRRAETADRFSLIRPVAVRDGVQYVDVNLRVTNDGQ